METVVAGPPSFHHFQLPGDFRLAINANKKMKTISVLVFLVGNLDETVTRKALLPMILRRGTRHHPDMQAINRYLEGLYGTSLSSAVYKIGEWHVVRFRLDVVNERFLPGESGLFQKGLGFLREILLEPLDVAGGFQPEFLEQEKNNLKRSIESLVDNKAAYAENRLLEEMCRNEPFRLFEHGRVEDIPAIEARPFHDFHREWVESHPLYLYVTGDIEIEAARNLVASVFLERDRGRRQGGYVLKPLPPPVKAEGVREVTEHMDVNQARLVLGFRHGITYDDEAYEALLLMNGILGGFSHSKLFQNVREKANLAYSVHSSLERTKGLLFISSGIAAAKHEEALRIILDQVKAMVEGKITDEEMEATVASFLNRNEMLEDNLPQLSETDFVWSLHGRTLDLAALRERLLRVRKDGIVEVARRLVHDTTYFLTT